jgi:hypothetical protein
MTEEKNPASSTKKSGGHTTVRVSYPIGSFEGEGFPTITQEGTELSSTQLKAAQEAANENGIPLIVEDGS